ncbi:MAG TPA: RDD family protein [Rhizomicrobium sp.]|nr:RDD family protein [Rhizomicrobium sp.]
MSDLRGGFPGQPAEKYATIAGFWRRVLALLIDMLLLAAVGIAIGTVAYHYLLALGQEGRLIGAAITLVYYGVLNSGVGWATFGKHLMGLRVVRRDGQQIAIFRSFLRTVAFWTPGYLNGVFFSHVAIPGVPVDTRIDAIVGGLDILIVFGGMILIPYFYVFNTRTRQSLHDLIAGTYVVKWEELPAPVVGHIWRGHYVAATVVCLVCAGIPAWLPGVLPQISQTSMDNLTAIQLAVLARSEVTVAAVQTNSFTAWQTGQPATRRTSLIVDTRVRDVPASMAAEENAIANVVLEKTPTIVGQQILTVKVSYGYDIGIWQWSYGDQWSGTPPQWQRRIGKIGA